MNGILEYQQLDYNNSGEQPKRNFQFVIMTPADMSTILKKIATNMKTLSGISIILLIIINMSDERYEGRRQSSGISELSEG